jgi:nucleotidyltransferase/DNA polymerase involved in DNA repair
MNSKVILHIDMDAFFASVEQRDNPKLRGKPVIIGADPKGGKGRGVVSTCSYEARPFGVHSAQPISKAYQLCPQGIFLPGNHKKYSAVAREIRTIFYDFTPDVEPISIDEAFLDITGSFHFFKTPLGTAQELKRRIEEKVRLTSSIGIAPVKMVAKIASDYSKPNGLLEILPDQVLPFLHPLPIERLWGVGPKSKAAMNALGIHTIGDLAQIPPEKIGARFGEHGLHLHELANGIDPREVYDSEEVKSVSHEHTFDADTDNLEEIRRIILDLSERVSRRLRKYGLRGKTVTLKIRLKGFRTYTRNLTLEQGTNLIDDILSAAQKMFESFYQSGQEIRLVGVRVTNFTEGAIQEDLFAPGAIARKENIHKAMDAIKDKFGEEAIHRGF